MRGAEAAANALSALPSKYLPGALGERGKRGENASHGPGPALIPSFCEFRKLPARPDPTGSAWVLILPRGIRRRQAMLRSPRVPSPSASGRPLGRPDREKGAEFPDFCGRDEPRPAQRGVRWCHQQRGRARAGIGGARGRVAPDIPVLTVPGRGWQQPRCHPGSCPGLSHPVLSVPRVPSASQSRSSPFILFMCILSPLFAFYPLYLHFIPFICI